MVEQQFSNRQAMADATEMSRIAEELEQRRRGKHDPDDFLTLEMRIQTRIMKWMEKGRIKNPLRPLGPALEQARREKRASQLSTRAIGRGRAYFAVLINEHYTQHRPHTEIRTMFAERIEAGDAQAAETLRVLELTDPKWLDGTVGKRGV